MALGVRKRKDGTVAAGRYDGAVGQILEGEFPGRHHFGTKWVTKAVVDGLVTVGKGQIVIHTTDGDAVYAIERNPGAYCLHCGDQVGDGPARTAAESQRRIGYVETCQVFHNPSETGDPSDPVNRYEVVDFYDAVFAEFRPAQRDEEE